MMGSCSSSWKKKKVHKSGSFVFFVSIENSDSDPQLKFTQTESRRTIISKWSYVACGRPSPQGELILT